MWKSLCTRAVRISLRLRKRIASPRAAIARLGTIVAIVTVIAPPATYAWISATQLQQRALDQAALRARHVEVQLTKRDSVDWLTQVSISVLHATQGTGSVVASWVTDTAGTTLMFQGHSAWWPEVHAKAKISSAAFKGYFNVAVSTREVFIGTLHAAVAFLLLGLAAYFCFQRLPLAALDSPARKFASTTFEM
jgi:hypothetical protein